MSHHQDGSPETDQILFQPLGHRIVQVVGRLVQYQDVRRRKKRIDQSHPLLLPAGHVVDTLFIICEFQPVQHGLGIRLYGPAVQFIHIALHRSFQYRGSFLKDRRLGQIADLHLPAHADLSRIAWLDPGCHLKQRGLSHSVNSDYADLFILINAKSFIVQQHPVRIRLRYMFHCQQIHLYHLLLFAISFPIIQNKERNHKAKRT